MKYFECDYRFCQLYRSCPKNHQVEATPHSDVDEAGMPLYFGRCEEISRTFSEVPFERIVTIEKAQEEFPLQEGQTVRLDPEQEERLMAAINAPKTIGSFTKDGANEQAKIIKQVIRKKKDAGGKLGDKIDQDQVAKDFGVTRQTIIRWEQKEKPNGPTNKSNPWGYYSNLRKNPDLRGAYLMLVDEVKKYNEYKDRCKNRGESIITFVQYKEGWAKHNKKYGGV